MKSEHQELKTIVLSLPHIKKTVEQRGIFIVDELASKNYFLGYPEAAVWELIISGYTINQMVPMLSAIQQLNADETLILIHECLRKWEDQGLVKIEKKDV